MKKLKKVKSFEFRKNKRLTELLKNYHKDQEDMEFKSVYNYKKLEIHYSIKSGKKHISIHNNVKWGEIYDDDIERIAKKFLKEIKYEVIKGIMGGIVHLWEK